MKKFLMYVLIMFVGLIGLSGCSAEVVPPAHKGKVLTTQGYNPEVIEPGKLFLWGRDELVLLDMSTTIVKEVMKVILSDKMKLSFDVRARVRINPDVNTINSMFNDIKPVNGIVNIETVYGVYGQMIIRNISRTVVGKYTVNDVANNYPKVSGELFKEITEAFKGTPLQLSEVSIGQIDFPAIVTKAVEAAKARTMQIEEEQAKVQIELERKRGQEQVAEADYRIRMIRAKTIRDENKLVAEGVSDEYLKYRSLEVQEKMAGNNSAVFIPYESLNTTGASVRMYNNKK